VGEESVGLFCNEREANFESAVAMIEDVLIELGHFVNDCRIASPEARRAWRVRKGSAEVVITLIERDDYWHLRVVAAVMTLDDSVKRETLFSRVLELNSNEVHGAAFALRHPYLILLAERTTLDLDRSEVYDTINRVQNYADDWDDRLVAEYGGTLGAAD
jgi:hypothetical protein